MQSQGTVGPLVRGTPGYDPALLGSTEQFLHIPLPPESVNDPASAPDMMVGTQDASPQARALQQSPPGLIDVPMERYLPTRLFHRGHHEFRQVLALQHLPHSILQCLPLDAAARCPLLQLAEFPFGLAQRYRDTPLLSAQ